VSIGDHTFISPQATLIGCTVESYAYIATGSAVLTVAFNVGPLVHDRSSVMKKVAAVRSKEFESHFNDEMLP
jgi:carbonic anhydrase/acetyltransferase-like protein (isoleucine patch superfamily)